MPQAIVAAVVMQVVQAVVQKVIEAVSEGLQNNQSQPEMEQTAKKTMEDDGYNDRDQQHGILNDASDTAMRQGKMMESVVLSAAAKALGGMAT
jgi:F420-dependent methylenetetrahydromethanopterin dehydrogenase